MTSWPSHGRRASSKRANAAKSSMFVSTHQAIEDTLTNQIRLFFPLSRVTGNIQPNLQDVAISEPVRANDCAKNRFGRLRLPNNDVRNLSSRGRHKMLPGG